MSHSIPPSPCVLCGYVMDAATSPCGDDAPKPEDLTVCFRCGALLVFTAALQHRLLTDGEFVQLPESTRRELTSIRDKVMAKAGTR